MGGALVGVDVMEERLWVEEEEGGEREEGRGGWYTSWNLAVASFTPGLRSG